MIRPPHRRASIATATAMAIVALAGCGGGTPGPSAAGPSGPAQLPSMTTTRACDVLTDADILEITGMTVVSKDDNVADTVYANHCRWTLQRSDGGTGELDLGILSPGGRDRYDHTGGPSGLEPIDGLPADDAGTDDLTGSIFAVRGDTLVDVFSVGLGLSESTEIELTRHVLEQLDQ